MSNGDAQAVNGTICILGAAGFMGARSLRRLSGAGCEVRLLEHHRIVDAAAGATRVSGDAGDAAALDAALVPGCVVLNFVYGGAGDAVRLAEAIGAACARRGARRLVHVSTTDVYGGAPGQLIDESSPCDPRTDYERAKHACEGIVAAAVGEACELVILRPTAVFGPGGRNLESLALRTLRQPWPRRYLRACAMGRRRMHAVDVEHVAAAVQWAAAAPLAQRHETFIISQDDDPRNEYASLEAYFASQFGRTAYPVPPLALPDGLRRLALRLAGRSVVDPRRRYSAAKLGSAGFRGPRPFSDALAEYAAWLSSRAAAA